MNASSGPVLRHRWFQPRADVGEFTTSAFCEIDRFCRAVLRKWWKGVPIYGGIQKAAKHFRLLGTIDIVVGGFPCQDISTAGKAAGLDGARSSLWWEMRSVIRDVRPCWVLIENVSALRVRGADRVLASLEELDYACWALVVGAFLAGAPHKRERVFIVGYANNKGQHRPQVSTEQGQNIPHAARATVGYADAGPQRAKRSQGRRSVVEAKPKLSQSVRDGVLDNAEDKRLSGGGAKRK